MNLYGESDISLVKKKKNYWEKNLEENLQKLFSLIASVWIVHFR